MLYKFWKILGYITLLIFVDQYSKNLIVKKVGIKEVEIVTDFFYLVYRENFSAAFSFLSFIPIYIRYKMLIFLSFGSICVIIYILVLNYKLSIKQLNYIILILGGALSNFGDRLYYGYVRDFLDISLNGMHWPTFNFADICIVLGIFLLCCQILIVNFNKVYYWE